MRTPTIPSRSRRARRTRAAATLRPVPSRRDRGDLTTEAVTRSPRRKRRARGSILYVSPRPARTAPLLRLVVSNPNVRALGSAITRRGHLTLVAARATPMGPTAHVIEPWAEDEPRAYLMIVLGLAAAGLVAVATSIGRLISAAL